jgi:hypothetical protein
MTVVRSRRTAAGEMVVDVSSEESESTGYEKPSVVPQQRRQGPGCICQCDSAAGGGSGSGT